MPSTLTSLDRLRLRVISIATTLLNAMSSGLGRISIITLGVIVAGYLMYHSTWMPLQQTAALPAGISPTNPELTVSALQDINADRTTRVQSVRRNFSRYTTLFVPPR